MIRKVASLELNGSFIVVNLPSDRKAGGGHTGVVRTVDVARPRNLIFKNGACGREGVIPLRIAYVLWGRVLAKQSSVSENVTDFHLE